MKVLIIGFAKIKYMPYLRFYYDALCADNEIHILYWNRDGKAEDLSGYSEAKVCEFNRYQEDNVSRRKKILNFLRFRQFVKKELRKTNYDQIICLHTFPAVLISDVLKKRYKGRYIFDYRDSTYESWGPFKTIIGNLVKNSKVTFISSEAFKKMLPDKCDDKIYISHNILLDSLEHRYFKERKEHEKIRVAFWGYIRNFELNVEIIKKISADSRFELNYYGREQNIAKRLREYAEEIGAQNVKFHGEYVPEDRYKFAECADIMHNMYDDPNMMLAVGNKYYDGAIFYIPQLCFAGSQMGKSVIKNGIGVECDPYSESFTEDIWNYYKNINKTEFFKNCDDTINAVLEDYHMGRKIIKNAIGCKKD